MPKGTGLIHECGAKTRAGGQCKAPAMANGRCRVHGGAVKVPPGHSKGNNNAVKHGLYRHYLDTAEQATWDDMELGNVDAELKLTRIQLQRALKLHEDSRKLKGDAGLELSEEKVSTIGGAKYVDRKYIKRDWRPEIARLTRLVESLERTRADLIRARGPGDDTPVQGFDLDVVRGKPRPLTDDERGDAE